MVTQLSPSSTVWNPEQEDEAVALPVDTAVVEVAFKAIDVGVAYAYPVAPQLEVREANSSAASSLYPNGNRSCVCRRRSSQAEQLCAAEYVDPLAIQELVIVSQYSFVDLLTRSIHIYDDASCFLYGVNSYGSFKQETEVA